MYYQVQRKILVTATLFFGALSVLAQEKVMNIQKKDGSSAQTRVADLKEISFLTVDEGSDLMLEKLTNGAVFHTDVDEVDEVTFADTTYNLNSSGYRILEANELCWPEDRLLPSFLPPAKTLRSLDMSAGCDESEFEQQMYSIKAFDGQKSMHLAQQLMQKNDFITIISGNIN